MTSSGIVKETILSDTDKLDWIEKEDTTIIVFLPLPRADRAKSRESAENQLITRKQPGNRKEDTTYHTATTSGDNSATIPTFGTDPEEMGKNFEQLGNPLLGPPNVCASSRHLE